MLFVLICTEGEVSEPECIKAFLSTIRSQVPQSGSENVDVITVPLYGNQGYKILIEKSEEHIKQMEADPGSILSLASKDDAKEKWLVCDYDQLDSTGMTYDQFKDHVRDAGYTLVMNKPNFEYFILAVLAGWEVASKTKASDIEKKINIYIDKLNHSNKVEKDFSEALMIPYYSKKHFAAERLFGMLFHYNKELFFNIERSDKSKSGTFSDMPMLINRLKTIYKIR